jgi:serine protease Do
MNTLRRQNPWVISTVSLASLMIGAAMFSHSPLVGRQPALAAPQTAAPQVKHNVNAKELSAGFREVAHLALPAIVSIETRGKLVKARTAEDGDVAPMEELPFGELFKDNPQFREFFRRRGGGVPQQMPRTHGMGSGFIVDSSGVIVTNNHVVADADQVTVHLQDGSQYTSSDWKTDPRSDVAIIRIKPQAQLPTLKLGDSDSTQIGDWVLAVGSPFGLDFTVTAGIISAKGRGQGILDREDFIQTDAAINPGNSGGPLLNLDGEVIGINTAISSRSGGYQGVGFAIPINMVRWVSKQLIEHGQVRRAYLGVAIQPVSNELARQFGVKPGQGAIVGNVVPGSPAADAKLDAGDVILSLDGKAVTNPRNLQGIVEQLDIGKSYALEILRDGKKQTLHVTIKEMPNNYTALATGGNGKGSEKEHDAVKPSQFKDLGVEVQEPQPQLTEQLGYKGPQTGVLITEVAEDSPAAAAGLQSGMIIEKVGTKHVKDVAEFSAAVKDLSVEKGILLLVRTPTGSRFVVVTKES